MMTTRRDPRTCPAKTVRNIGYKEGRKKNRSRVRCEHGRRVGSGETPITEASTIQSRRRGRILAKEDKTMRGKACSDSREKKKREGNAGGIRT